jgi:NADH-quinone oxidoreductase subunit M
MACCKSLELTTLNMVKFSYLEQTFISLFFFIGFGIKIPVWPFHYWLTKVHVEAPTGFSIFLSGFLVKTAFFCFSYVYIIFTNKVATLVCVSIVVWGALDSSIRM